MKKKRIITKIRQASLILLATLFLALSQAHPASADLSPDDVQALLNNWPAWVVGDTLTPACNAITINAVNGGDNNNKGSWSSGQQPPYILETFMIEVLKDIAQKRGVSQQDILTEEHVIALVAFAIGEGGDINNHDIFNPLNTGINAPDLASTEHNASGLQSFKSFDAGVEANARVMTGKNQRRLSDILIQPDSTAQEFMKALTYFNQYPGNKLWAEASLPPHADSYYQQRLQLVSQVRKNYTKLAALVIGTPELEFQTGKTVPSKLQFHPEGSEAFTPAVSEGDACPEDTTSDSAVQGNFFQTISKYAWPTYHDAPYFTYKPEYQAAVKAAQKRGDYVGGGAHPGIDCGGFVTLVFHDSGTDKNYNGYHSNVVAQQRWLDNHPKQYEKKTDITGAGDLHPGDIFINSDASHTYIFVGDKLGKNFKGNAASASFSTTGRSWRTPMASNAYGFRDATWYRPLMLNKTDTTI
jgi:hypothetical protein